jgi:sulfite reductase beta subunit-like hemoprotein
MVITRSTDTPGNVIPIRDEEFEDFDTESLAFLRKQREEEAFVGFRLKQGVYGQRQADVQMIRVKLPFGGVSADQLDAFGEVAERFAPLNKGHITTRENVQYHHVPLPLAAQAIRLMGASGLSTREACGNTVRNVTGDPWAGICDDEPFDATPYAGAFVRYFVRHPLTQLLPRKFKVAFSGSEADRVVTDIHDLGFIAQVRQENGEEIRGFKIVTGGGLSIMPKQAFVLYDFVPMAEYLRISEAVLRIFERSDELRRNRAKARIKFLVHRVGIEAFLEMVEDELEGDWAKREYPLDELLFRDDESADAPMLVTEAPEIAEADQEMFERFMRTNVTAQRQTGYSAVEVKVDRGDLSPEQFQGLARILRTYGSGRARTTPWQNIVLRWIPDNQVYPVWQELYKLSLGKPGSLEITDVVSCPGTDSCKLGITSSMGLNRAVQGKVEEMNIQDPMTRQILINMSGCPNSCGMHHVGNIGFHGAAIKSDGRQVPAYHVFVGGNRRAGKAMRIGTLLRTRLPAKRVPLAVERLILDYEENRVDDDEPFNTYNERQGKAYFDNLLSDLSLPPEFNDENREHFVDWDRDRLYVLERGEGECAV